MDAGPTEASAWPVESWHGPEVEAEAAAMAEGVFGRASAIAIEAAAAATVGVDDGVDPLWAECAVEQAAQLFDQMWNSVLDGSVLPDTPVVARSAEPAPALKRATLTDQDPKHEAELREAFDKFDTDRSGAQALAGKP